MFNDTGFINSMKNISDFFNNMFEDFYYNLPILLQYFLLFIFDGLLILIILKVGGFK